MSQSILETTGPQKLVHSLEIYQCVVDEVDALIKELGADPDELRETVVNEMIGRTVCRIPKSRRIIREVILDRKKKDKQDVKKVSKLLNEIFQGLRP